ncbi:hypothetical protein BGZ61DRAFT_486596 [Ilyonectria robusta]|uniref:uncharacterized protein n=1 Tax=Ilyonectria robusta TaxID=1079257 RepID=UPI001E8EB610|nr:uncharacterized protein BGZ61DRAFT_486596 [Ilyonectria robusta]KAH8656365.1 hypothetical protein BGZ61DRAFT_486596 [Ilyonectria robusta]
MQFQETEPDQVLDIEQSETTKWLQHTGWPQLFRNRPLDIIAASSLQPGPAWNEDYLLGSWQGTQIWSSVAVEAQLRIILRGVDLMFDRAKFTLARTSYRSRCWLNTYWKDVFWPHEFRIISSQKRYISTWKRFICFIFRTLQSSPQLRREIYNLRLRPDEVKMMRHILDLASTLQQQGKEEWDDDSEYASQDEGEESSDGEDNESLEDYDGESVETDEDEDVEYDSGDRDELMAFTLPPGFWLHLSEAIFQLSMMFWTHRDPAGDMSSSVLIHYTAVMGIQRDSLVYNSAYNSTPKLAALMWIGRLLFLEYALPVYTYDTLAFPWPCRTSYPSQPDRLDSIRRKYLLRGCYTPFGEMIELKAFTKSIMKREGIPGNLSWAPDGRSFTIGDDKKVQLSEFCETYHKVMAQVHEQVNEMMLGWDPSIDLSTIRDDLTCRTAGWSFLRKAENNLGSIWKTLLQRLESSSFRGRPFIKSGS